MKINIDKKRYIVLLSAIISLFVICLFSMFAFLYTSYNKSPLIPLAILSALSLIAVIVISSLFHSSMTQYEKFSLANKLSKRDFKRIATSLTYENITYILGEKGFKKSAENNDIFARKYNDNVGDGGILTCYEDVFVSKYSKDMIINSPIQEESYLSTHIYLWIIFFDELNDDILADFKEYELNEIKRTDHKIFRRCCYYPVVLIHQGTAYYLDFNKLSTQIFLNLIKDKKSK